MRTADVDILIVPGWTRNSDDHWQSRWARNLRTARTVVQDDWDRPEREAWTGRIREALSETRRPAVLVAHSCGVLAVVHAAQMADMPMVAGAFLVAPPDLEDRAPVEAFMRDAGPEVAFPETFLPPPDTPLPFPSVVIASSNDPFCSLARARVFASAWGSAFVDAGPSGHLNTASGHGPWPEGLLRFGAFLAPLG